MEIHSYEDLVVQLLLPLYQGERRQVEVFQIFEQEVANRDLKLFFRNHGRETIQQTGRIERIFEELRFSIQLPGAAVFDPALEQMLGFLPGLIAPDMKNCALAVWGMRMETSEIVSYRWAMQMAKRAGKHAVSRILKESLSEEQEALRSLRGIADRCLHRPERRLLRVGPDTLRA